MEPKRSPNITQMLIELTEGNKEVVDQILPLVYAELRKLASGYLMKERRNHTLQPTALVHEAYLKLIDQNAVEWQNRSHFFGIAAQIMRRILIDHARNHKAEKRGGADEKISLDDKIIVVDREKTHKLLALDEALEKLAKIDELKAKIVELRYFGGLSGKEAAEVLGLSEITVKRHWRMAKAWLYGQVV
ncbi:MAG: sigma-70 family RNA polymerase sigma factor [Pyrinomonadaceae bacterium]|nr:sigma-70 family RNA polymerase sigma factor [Pyrinomonadaceae bacterium]